jgi:hypothetical protein
MPCRISGFGTDQPLPLSFGKSSRSFDPQPDSFSAGDCRFYAEYFCFRKAITASRPTSFFQK